MDVGIGGGSAVYIHETIPAKHRRDLENKDLEMVVCEIVHQRKKFIIASCYQPPGMSALLVTNFINNMQAFFVSVCAENPEAFFLLGDLNDHCLDWNSIHRLSELKNRLVDLVNKNNNFFQVINEPTHITPTNHSLLDVIITDAPGYIIDSGTLAPMGDNFHCRIYCKVRVKFRREPAHKRLIWNYKDADFTGLHTALRNAPWMFDIFDNIDDGVDYFESLLLNTAHEYIPNKTVVIRPRDKPWFNNDVRRAFRKRDCAYNTWKRHRSPENYDTYKNLRHEANYAKALAKQVYHQKLSSKLIDPTTCPKQFWKITKQLYGNKIQSSIPPLIKNDIVYNSAQDKCNIFNETFTKKSKLPDEKPTLPTINLTTNQKIDTIYTTEDEVCKILKSLDTSKACGPDGISPKLLKNTANTLALPLTTLFNLSLRTGVFPSKWKQANVSPIHKKNDKQDDNNYRPISLLSCVGKLLERIVFIKLYKFCITNNILTWHNSGYKHQDSTVNQMVFICHKIYEALSNGSDVCFVSLDASSAFNRVWHKGLLYKLKTIGVCGKLLDWFENYLSDRLQRVVIGGSSSEWIQIEAGVPQGSILGPLLFLIYINDIVQDIHSNILLFADDTSLVKTLTDEHSITEINTDLETLRKWSTTWLVNFNPSKTKYMIFSKKHNKLNYNDLHLGNKIIEQVENHKQLGITLNNSMTWENHINDICKKAGKRIDLLKRLPPAITPHTKLQIYLSFIRPVLEYGSVLFDDCTQILSNKLENIQRQAALSITRAYQHTSHLTLLKELGLEPLNQRRKQAKLNIFYKIKNNLTPQYLKILIPPEVGESTTYNLRNSDSIKLIKSDKKYLLKSYIPSTIKLWNAVPLDIRNSNTLDTFKCKLHRTFVSYTAYTPYLTGTTTGHIQLSRIRMGLSGLNSHRKKYHFIDHNNCPQCNTKNENDTHYFLTCTKYAAQRQSMLTQLGGILPQHLTLINNLTSNNKRTLCKIITHGTGIINIDINIFNIVATFIISTGRFDINV